MNTKEISRHIHVLSGILNRSFDQDDIEGYVIEPMGLHVVSSDGLVEAQITVVFRHPPEGRADGAAVPMQSYVMSAGVATPKAPPKEVEKTDPRRFPCPGDSEGHHHWDTLRSDESPIAILMACHRCGDAIYVKPANVGWT